MEKIKKGIVFSNDINLILNGSNALDYKYECLLPSEAFINNLREDFIKTTKKIFNCVTIISEEQMTTSLNQLLNWSLSLCPHCSYTR